MDIIKQRFEHWQSKLEDFQGNLEKELADIRQCKQEIQGMKNELMEELGEISQLSRGKYIRDNQRIILSAPEIVIGNVDKNGVMLNMHSNIVVRGNDVALEGVGMNLGSGGKVTTRAAQIRQIAEDPGKDGLEHAVLPVSEVVTQAKAITLRTESVDGTFVTPAVATMQGIELNSESGIALHATCSVEKKKSGVKNAAKSLKEYAKALKDQVKEQKKVVDGYIKEMQRLSDSEDLTDSIITTRTSYLDIDELMDEFHHLSGRLYSAMNDYYQTLSLLAETNRQVSCLESIEKTVDKKKASFKNKPTGAFISLKSERIDAVSVDGDGNYRENPEAGISFTAKHVDIGTFKADESLQDESTINLASRKVEISTIDPKVERNDKGEITKGDYPAVGDVIIKSKNIQMETVDYEWKDKKQQEKMLTKDGTIAIRAEKVDVSVTDTEGKATGQVEVNAKAVEVKSMDVDKEKRTDKSLAAGSTMLLLSEKMYVGAKDSKTRSQQMQVASDKTGIFADTTLELQQAKAVVQLSGGNAAVGGGNLDLYGKTTLQGEVTAKGAITGGDIEMKNMKVKSSFKSPATSEGVAVPGAPATGKLSAKLKEEELKTKEK